MLSQAAPTALANPQRGNTRSHPKHDRESSSSDDSIGQRCGRIKRCHSTRLSRTKDDDSYEDNTLDASQSHLLTRS